MKLFRYLPAIVVILALSIGGVCAQTPPVSTVLALPDTTFTSEIKIDFTVDSDIAWEAGGGVGFYYRLPSMVDWAYISEIGGATSSPVFWTPPFANIEYEFCTTVTDNEGNNEGYNFTVEANTFYAPGELPPDLPTIMWHWTHPTTGSEVVEYIAEWMVNGTITIVDGIAVGDTTFAFLEVPYTPNSMQTIRVRGMDAVGSVGPFSEWAEPWSDVFPGKPGTPAGTLIVKPSG